MPADPRPEGRVVDPLAGLEKLQRERRCRACGLVGVSKLSRHHLVPRGQGGDDVEENIVPLCGNGTMGCHGALTDHTNRAGFPSQLRGNSWRGVAYHLRQNLTNAERQYIVDVKGHDWLNRHYPKVAYEL